VTWSSWDAAFVFDTRDGADAAASILEFANTQLVEWRTYDVRLDAELDTSYKMDWGRTRAASSWRSLSIVLIAIELVLGLLALHH
jgi:hypothetical protein